MELREQETNVMWKLNTRHSENCQANKGGVNSPVNNSITVMQHELPHNLSHIRKSWSIKDSRIGDGIEFRSRVRNPCQR